MKITTTQYAKALYATTAGKSEKDIADLILNLTKVLVRNRQMKLFSKITQKFTEIWNQEKGIVEAEITSREELRSELRSKVSAYIKEKYQAKEVVLHNIVDEKIQGGIIIRVGDEVLDGSITRQLQELKNNLINQ
ncbi:ATP synthase F1 subunit delta [Patescibacteria group bacterium]|nr:ATP synthase F1 subunit delta [Patescibacteria group bacterium]